MAPSSRQELEDLRASEKELAELEARHGFLPADHPIRKRVDAVAHRLLQTGPELAGKPGPRVHVLRDHPDADAFVLANGAVVVTPGFLRLLESEDQVAAVLAHEFTHYVNGHFLPGVRSRSPQRVVGGMRLQEYEADITASVRWLGSAGYQPLAMATLCEALQRVPGFRGWGVVHGTLEDRRLNVRTLEHLPIVNLEGIDRPEQPLPADWVSSLPSIPKRLVETSFETRLVRLRERGSDAIRALAGEVRNGPTVQTWELLKQALPDLVTGATARSGGSTNEECIAHLTTLLQSLDDLLARQPSVAQDHHARTLALLGLLTGPLELKLLTGSGRPPVRPLDALPLRMQDGTLFRHRVQAAVSELGPRSLAAGVAPVMGDLPGAAALIRPIADLEILPLADYVAEREVFHGVESGKRSPALLASAVQLTIAAFDRNARAGNSAPVDVSSLRETLFHRAVSKWNFKLTSLVRHGLHRDDLVDRQILSAIAFQTCTPLEGLTPVSAAFQTLYGKLLSPAVPEGKAPEREGQAAGRYFAEDPDFAHDLDSTLAAISTSDAGLLVTLLAETLPGMEHSFESIDEIRRHDRATFETRWPQLFESAMDRLGPDFTFVAGPIFSFYVDHLLGSAAYGERDRLLDLLEKTTRELHGNNPNWIQDQRNLDRKMTSLLLRVVPSDRPEEAWEAIRRLVPYCASGSPDAGAAVEESVRLAQMHIKRLWPGARGSPERLLLLSNFFLDADIRQRISAYAVDLSRSTLSFDAARAIAFGPGSDLSITGPMAEHLVETLATTTSEMESLKQDFTKLYARQAALSAGAATALDGFMELSFKRSEELVSAGLVSTVSDRDLARLNLQEWWRYMVRSGAVGDFDPATLDYFDSPEAVEEWAASALGRVPDEESLQDRGQVALARMSNVTEMMERLQGATNSTKHAIARKLLMGQENGVLRNRDQTVALLEKLCQYHLDLQPAALEEVRRIGHSLQRVATSDELYFLLGPQLALRLFQRSQHVANREELVDHLIFDQVDRELGGAVVSGPLRPEVRGQFKDKAEVLRAKIMVSAFNKDALLGQTRNEERDVLTQLPAEYQTAAATPKLAGMEALLKLASQLGSGPVRGLQVAGQYLDLDDATLESLSAAYDDNFGQSKMAAMETIKAHAPQLLAPEDQLVARLGGGSLVTVYKLIKAASSPAVAGAPPPGGSYVVKVLNPNAMARTRKVMDLARRVLADLRTHHPERKEYELFGGMIDDLEEWIEADIHDTTFGAIDPSFKSRYDGFRPRDHRFAVKVPRSFASNQWVKTEELVEGKNLTQFRRAAKTDFEAGTLSAADFQDVISVYTKCFWDQLQEGTVLSDVSKGNVRLTPRDQVTILDRQLYQRLTEQDRSLFKEMLSRPEPGLVMDYLLAQDRNSAARGDRAALLARIQGRLTGVDLGSGQGLRALVVAMRQEGLRFPLRMTLLLKNLNAIDKLSREAGFDEGIKGALLHKTNLLEKLKLWGELKR